MTKIDLNIFSSIFCPTPPEAVEIEENQAPFREGAELILLL
jgi:hypothetical protein